MAANPGENGAVDVLLVPARARPDEAVAALREAADVYGWGLDADRADDGGVRARVVPGTCTRQPEARRVLERARATHADLLADVTIERAVRTRA